MIDIGRVFSTGWAMLKQRLWLLLGMWLVFLVIQLAFSTVFGLGLGGLGLAGGAALAGGIDNPAALLGMGAGVVFASLLFYAAYLALAFAQQGAMVVLASPLEQPSFGEALVTGGRSALTSLGLMLLLILAYLALALAGVVFTLAMGLLGDAGAGIAALLLVVLAVPAAVYIGCRLSVLIAVVAVERVFNPLAALRRCWAITRGKVPGILLVFIAFVVLAVVLLAVPLLMIVGPSFAGGPDSAAGAGGVLVGILLVFPLFILYSIATSVLVAALHAEVSAGGAERLEQVFA